MVRRTVISHKSPCFTRKHHQRHGDPRMHGQPRFLLWIGQMNTRKQTITTAIHKTHRFAKLSTESWLRPCGWPVVRRTVFSHKSPCFTRKHHQRHGAPRMHGQPRFLLCSGQMNTRKQTITPAIHKTHRFAKLSRESWL